MRCTETQSITPTQQLERAAPELPVLRLTINGDPRTKKNSMQIVRSGKGKPVPIQSAAYIRYAEAAAWQIRAQAAKLDTRLMPVTGPVNLRCVYFMQTRRAVDLPNLLEATCDILQDAHILVDDDRDHVAAMDGSRVMYDKQNPRVEILITPLGEEYERWKKEK